MFTMKRKLNVKNCFLALVYLLSILCWGWLIASYLDVILHNTTTCVYQDWNIFKILFFK